MASDDLGEWDVIVVGGGIAGLSLAGTLAAEARVLVLEREEAPAYHASGRSASLYIEPYSNEVVFALTRATLQFLQAPPEGFADGPLISPRGNLILAPPAQVTELDAFLAQWRARCPGVRAIGLDEAHARLPVLRRGFAARAAFDDDCRDLDTHAMLQGWQRLLRAGGGELRPGVAVQGASRRGGALELVTTAGRYRAPVVVNAAGAWAAALASCCGALPIPLQPKRRSAAVVEPPAGHDSRDWPVVADAAHTFYFKPEGGDLMLSPSDATPSPACDARPEEIDVARAVARAEEAAELGVQRLRATWAGLRTFAPDGVPVMGWDPRVPGFYWLAGQGGTGFQTSAAAARWAAEEISERRPPERLRADIAPEQLAPTRFGG